MKVKARRVTKQPPRPHRAIRDRNASCPMCGADSDRWCFSGCKALDLADWR